MRNKRPLRQGRGFSLIELLMVVAMVVILVAMLLPSMNGLQDRARFLSCKAHLRQVGANINLYEYERQQYPNPASWVHGGGSRGGIWAGWSYKDNVTNGQLWPYMGGALDAYLCPTFKFIYNKYPTFAHIDEAWVSYCYNEYFNGTWQRAGATYGAGKAFQAKNNSGQNMVNRALIIRPSKLVMVAEENPYFTIYNNYLINNLALGIGNFDTSDSASGSKVDGLASFHERFGDEVLEDGFSNAVFVDGHVELVSPKDTKELCTPHRVKMHDNPNIGPSD